MTAGDSAPLAIPDFDPDQQLGAEELKSCCAAIYEHAAVRWLLGNELHPGGQATTRRALQLAGLGRGDRLLDVASGTGSSAILAATEFECRVVGVEYSDAAVREASAAARSKGLNGSVRFVQGDAERLRFADGSFDVVLCECALCTFPNKARAAAEMHRVLRSGGRLALSDVVVETDRLPQALRGALATIACVGSALSGRGYEELLGGAGLRVFSTESRGEDVAGLARRIEERLRGARLLGLDSWVGGTEVEIEDAIEMARLARRAISEGSLGYAIIGAVR